MTEHRENRRLGRVLDALRTQQAYVDQIRRVILFRDKRHPGEVDGDGTEEYVTDPAERCQRQTA